MISQSLSNINIHKNKVACTSCHHEQMEDLMTAEAWMAVIEDGQLQGIDDAADGR